MKVSVKYHEILEEDLKEELIWLIEEFQILFKSKLEKYSEKDKEIANKILDYMLNNTYAYESIQLYNLLFDAIENIEKTYPNLF
ncbi:MAG: hypothetical protein ACFFKA_18560 [Candidatus Thorarchaeota archaeon]|jgi:hypothetical protein